MLLEIQVHNVALIDALCLELGEGLNVLTGETGAGKSILVGALNLVLGGRADRSIIRTGEEQASVEALFDIGNCPEARELLAEWGIEGDGNLVSVKRSLTAAGRSLCRVAGSVLPLSRFRQLTGALVELHGQHEHQKLCDEGQHTGFLDAFGGLEHQRLLEKVAVDHESFAGLRRQAERLKGDLAERERLRDVLCYQIDEIDQVRPKAGEMEKLQQKSRLLGSAMKISQRLERACDLVYRGGKDASVQESLKKAADAMASIGDLDPRFESLARRLEELFYGAQDLGSELLDLCETTEFDPGEEERVASRLSALKGLTKKYGPELEDVIQFRARARERLEEIESGDERLAELERELDVADKKLEESCRALSDSRKALAPRLSERILEELKALGMEKARFAVRFQGTGEPTRQGAERAGFLLSANPGEPMKALADVASGGELSRIMLAMKTVAADQAGVDAMVFDEIDTGVSGRMAQAVGEKMALIAGRRQVICVSHLPQIAALGDRHYLVEKQEQGGRTSTTVRLLDEEGRIEELSRMVGGAGEMESSRTHAAHMLSAARDRATALRRAEREKRSNEHDGED